MKKVIIAGGSCGTGMVRIAEIIKDECYRKKIHIDISVHNLWESSFIGLDAYIVIQTFPFFKELPCYLLDGRPFINGIGQKALLNQIIDILEKEG